MRVDDWDWFGEIENAGGRVQRDDLIPWVSVTANNGATVDFLLDREFELGRATTIHLFEAAEAEPFGSAYIRYREEELVLSNVDFATNTRKGIGTQLVAALLGRFPDHRRRGEEPNLDALGWHKHLEAQYGNRMIPFSAAEVERAHKIWDGHSA